MTRAGLILSDSLTDTLPCWVWVTDSKLLRVTTMTRFCFHYTTFSKVLNKSFDDSKVIEADTQEQAEAKFRLFMLSLFSGNWSLRWVQDLAN